MRVLGIDPAWTRTGLAILDQPNRKGLIEHGIIVTDAKTKPDMLRLEMITDQILDFAQRNSPVDLVAIEGYSFGAKVAREKMGELGGVIRYRLWKEGYPFLVYTPFTWRKVLLGRAVAQKDQVGMMLVQRYHWDDIKDINALEAAGVATCALIHQGPVENWLEYQKAAFIKLNKAMMAE